MIVLATFMAVLGSMAIWWLSHQRLTSKPWLEVGCTPTAAPEREQKASTPTTGLRLFFAVAACLFTLLFSASLMRSEAPDWSPVPLPELFWFNTAVLIASSLALQWTLHAARRDAMEEVRAGLLMAFGCTLIFLAGQSSLWWQLAFDGYRVASNPASAFFYLISAVHGMHVLGGLVALARAGAKSWNGAGTKKSLVALSLCASYWHFLLMVWIVFVLLLAGWVEEVAALCRRIIT